MATRAEQFRYNEERRPKDATEKSPNKRSSRMSQRTKKNAAPRDNQRAGAKATYAKELPSASGRKSRKSTRKSANRAKADANLNRREAGAKGSPKAMHATTQAKVERPRGRGKRPNTR